MRRKDYSLRPLKPKIIIKQSIRSETDFQFGKEIQSYIIAQKKKKSFMIAWCTDKLPEIINLKLT